MFTKDKYTLSYLPYQISWAWGKTRLALSFVLFYSSFHLKIIVLFVLFLADMYCLSNSMNTLYHIHTAHLIFIRLSFWLYVQNTSTASTATTLF